MIKLILLIAVIILGGMFLLKINPDILSPINESLDQDVRLEIDTGSVSVADGNVSGSLITATVTRLDDGTEPRTYELKFSGDLQSIYPVDTSGKRLASHQIGPLIGKNAKEIFQFRITGTKGEFETAKANLPVALYRAGQQVSPTQTISVTVN